MRIEPEPSSQPFMTKSYARLRMFSVSWLKSVMLQSTGAENGLCANCQRAFSSFHSNIGKLSTQQQRNTFGSRRPSMPPTLRRRSPSAL
jgi:hypothetical protein